MTVSVPGSLTYSYSGDGSTTVFSYPVRFLADAELVVVLEDSDGTQVQKTLTTHYTVTGAGNVNGGSVTMLTAPASGETLRIYRKTAKKQVIDLADSTRNPAQSVEDQLDRFAMADQDMEAQLGRALKVKVGSTAPLFPAPSADKLIGWDADGDSLENKTTVDLDGEVLPAVASTFLRRNAGNTGFSAVSMGFVNVRWLGAAGDGVTDDTEAFQAAAALATEGVPIYVPAGNYMLSSGGFDVNGATSGVTIFGDGRGVTTITTATGAGQRAFVIRNSEGIHVWGLKFLSTATPATFQHNFELMNCSYAIVERCEFENAGGYGFGCYQDTVANPDTQTACNYIWFRHNIVRDAGQYGVQHFPKVVSDGFWCHDNLLVNCGHNPQNWVVPTEILPSAIKGGQTTNNAFIYNNTIFAADDAAGIDVGNFEDIEIYDNHVYNCTRQFLAVSVDQHANLTPYTPSFRRFIARNNKFIMEPGSGSRVASAITYFQESGITPGLIRFEDNYIEGENFSPSMRVAPTGALNQLEILSPKWSGSFSDSSIVIHVENSFGGTITDPLIRDVQIINYNLALTTLRGIQVEGAARGRILDGYLRNMGENAIDLRNCTNGMVVRGIEIDGYNLVNTAGKAAIAVTDSTTSDYFIQNVTLREGQGHAKVLISASSSSPEFFLSGNQLPVGIDEYGAPVTVVSDGVARGSWTPVLTFATPGDLAVTYSVQAGRYEKRGKRVTLWFSVVTSAFTHTTAASGVQITGLPYTASSAGFNRISTLQWQGITKASYTQFCAVLSSGGSHLIVTGSGSGVSSSAVTATDMPTSGTVALNGTIEYEVA